MHCEEGDLYPSGLSTQLLLSYLLKFFDTSPVGQFWGFLSKSKEKNQSKDIYILGWQKKKSGGNKQQWGTKSIFWEDH